MDISNQVAVVTGAGSGIGRAIALCLGEKRLRLALVGRTKEKLDVVAAAAKSSPAVRCYAVDLSLESNVARLGNDLQCDFGCVDILVHSAGAITLGRIVSSKVEDFDRQYCVNVRAPYLLTRALLPSLEASKGQIVFVNSTMGFETRANVAQYAASKHALRALADSLRQEVNGAGLRVLNIYLGRTATPMQAEIFKTEERDYRPELLMQPEDVASVVVHALSLPRTAEVTEIRMRPLAKSY